MTIGAETPWHRHRRRRRGDRPLDESELSMLAVDPGWGCNGVVSRPRSGRRNPMQQQDALDRAMSNAAGCLVQVMQELDLDPSTGVLTAPAFRRALTRLRADGHPDRAHAMLHLRIGNLDAMTARYGANAGGDALADLARLLQSLLRDGDPVGRPAKDALAAMMVHAPAETARDRLRMVRERAGRQRFRHGGTVIPFRLLASVVPVSSDMTGTAVLDNIVALTRAAEHEDPKP